MAWVDSGKTEGQKLTFRKIGVNIVKWLAFYVPYDKNSKACPLTLNSLVFVSYISFVFARKSLQNNFTAVIHRRHCCEGDNEFRNRRKISRQPEQVLTSQHEPAPWSYSVSGLVSEFT